MLCLYSHCSFTLELELAIREGRTVPGRNQAGFFHANKIATQLSLNPGRTGLKLPYKAKKFGWGKPNLTRFFQANKITALLGSNSG